MKYINQLLLLVVISLVTAVSYLGISGTWTYIFVLPLIIIVGFISLYLYKQFESDEKERKQKALKLAIEDEQAGKWIKNEFVPQAVGFGLHNRKILLVYFFAFIIGSFFLWYYISYGFESAIFNTIIGAVVLILFMIYIYFMSSFTAKLIKFIPANLHKYASDDWLRAYVYLLPIMFLANIFYPAKNIITSAPLFLLVYTFLFLGLYSIIYLYREIKKEEKSISD